MIMSVSPATPPDSAETAAQAPVPAPDMAPILAIESSCDDTAWPSWHPTARSWPRPFCRRPDMFPSAAWCRKSRPGPIWPPCRPWYATRWTWPPCLPRRWAPIAASTGPGLIGGLIVGAGMAKGLAVALGRPFVAVNHIEAHALTARLPGLVPGGASFPYLLLLVSGGHCQCIAVEGVGRYRKLGGTIDDAAGEAFDKVAKMLGLGWPGGPAVEALAREGDPAPWPLPRPLRGRPGCDFSFSGLKTAVAQKLAPFAAGALPRTAAAGIAASFQDAVADIVADRVAHALDMMPQATLLVAAGGVAANTALRTRLTTLATSRALPFAAPPLRLCTDNAVMVGWAAIETLRERRRLGLPPTDDLDLLPRPRWPLEQMAERFAHPAP
ncbi:putative O-sialoglycoprotein endopeptidase [Gluconacetobacter diazotrophicus PA1 5]|uniref:N(6)-L-threonylcarbamoyladenine synthase n=1 Tax=Gluconacetobacter diazotrophicus (strain ATCC 49037 / DSM 5601 / CCUG 37298 / CIP 103539 / LMG 7603 / PAl5) TaxID=272568 RepID=A9HKA0_GLUDA|nr:putative O-sialoglycoprotein endopeptidase [Gluconacetobacter diazotrophicus PA1 5]